MSKSDETERIEMIRANLEDGREKYNSGQVTHAQWKRMKKDASSRIAELKHQRKRN